MARGIKTAKGLKGKADKLYSQIIRLKGRCEVCGSDNWLQTAHIISRRFSNTRTDLRNSMCLCAKCHHHYTDHPVEWGKLVTNDDWWMSKYYPDVHKKSQLTSKVDWEERVEFLKDVYDRIQENELTIEEAREYEV